MVLYGVDATFSLSPGEHQGVYSLHVKPVSSTTYTGELYLLLNADELRRLEDCLWQSDMENGWSLATLSQPLPENEDRWKEVRDGEIERRD